MSEPTTPVSPAPDGDPPPGHSRLIHKIEGFLERNKMAGVPTPFEHVIEMFLGWWKRIGLRSALLLAILVLLPSIKYGVGPHLASSAAEVWASTLGLDLEVGDWSLDLHDLKVTAHAVRVAARGRHSHPNLFEARTVTIDTSLFSRLRGHGWIEEVIADQPVVYLERSLTGRWNWGELRESREMLAERARQAGAGGETLYLRVSNAAASAAPLDFFLPVVRAHDLKVRWVQNMPAQSGSGVVQALQGTVYIEDIELTIEDVGGFVDGRRAPTRISLEGRTADGRVSADGRANFFTWSAGAPTSGSDQADSGVSWTPTVDANLYLEHVGAAALGRLVPTAALTPSAGSLSGQIRLVLDRDRVGCQTTLTAENLAFTPNLESPVVRPRAAELTRQLVGYKASGPVLIGCEGSLSDTSFVPLEVIQTAMTQEITRTGPPLVRAVSSVDRARVAGTVDSSPEAVTAELGRQLAAAASAKFGNVAGQVVNDLVTPVPAASRSGSPGAQSETQSGGNPVTRGVKGFGTGVKKLFSGGKKP